MEKKTIRDIDLKNKKVLLRVDFNVPVVDGKISDDTRIKEALPTINYILGKDASIILMSHLGRPDGKVDNKYSLKVVYNYLKEIFKNKIKFAKDIVGEDAKTKVSKLKPKEILLLENLRFEKGEELNDPKLSKKLAKFGDFYVNDAFGTAHRKHCSTFGIAELLPSAVGFLIEKEMTEIDDVIKNPIRPFCAVLGGAKISDKINIIDSLIDRCDTIIIGGGMAFTFLKAEGYSVGKSLVDNDKLNDAKKLIKKAKEKNVNLLLPIDFVVSSFIADTKNVKRTKGIDIPEDKMGLDIGKKSIKLFGNAIKKCKTVIWNGPLGVFEKKAFSKGTYAIAKFISKTKGKKIVGGGDSVSAVVNMGLKDKFTHISTGGGASLKLFEGKELPGVQIIQNK